MRESRPKRGRPATGTKAVHLRFSNEVMEAIETYRKENLPAHNRQDAIRQLVHDYLMHIGFL